MQQGVTMSIKIVCPHCGGKFNVKDGTQICYCSFCGEKINVIRATENASNIDDSYISSDDDLSYPHMAQMYNKQFALKRKTKKTYIVLICLAIIVGIVYLFSRTQKAHEGKIQVPAGSATLEGKNYEDVVKQFKGKGFSNITIEPEGDLITGWLTEKDSVDSISINGIDDFSAMNWFAPNAQVVIRYHSFPDEGITTSADNNSENSVTSVLEAEPDAELPVAPLGEKNGFDESTNTKFNFHGVTFSIPSYYVVWDATSRGFEKGFYVKGDDPCDIAFNADDFNTASIGWHSLTQEQKEKLIDAGMESAIVGFKKDFPDSKTVTYKKINSNNMPIAIVTLDGDGYYKQIACVFCPKINKFVVAVLEADDETTHSYLSDFEKILQSVQYTDDIKGNTSPNNSAVSKSKSKNSSANKSTSSSLATKSKETSRAKGKGIEEQASTSSSTIDKSENQTKSSIPVFKGRSIDSVVDQASEYGLSVLYVENGGHGSHYKSLSDSSGGLMLDVYYADDTQEVFEASIVTNNFASAESQNHFIKGMSGILCPKEDSDEVEAWVKKNIGKEASTTINGIDYKLSLGPVGNLIFDAGMSRWEEWALQFDD